MKRSLSVIFLYIVLAAVFAAAASADTPVNGISIPQERVSRGDEFTVALYAPPSENADTASIKVVFDSSAFEVVTWDVTLPGGFANREDGFFALSAANATRAIDLSGGLSLSAVLRAKSDAGSGEYTFTLADSSLCYVDDSGCEFIELWTPDAVSAKVRIAGAEPYSGERKGDLPVSSQLDVPDSAGGGSGMIRVLIIAGTAVLLVVICLVLVKFGKKRK